MLRDFSYGDWVQLCEADETEAVRPVGMVIGRYADDESLLVSFGHGVIRVAAESITPLAAAR
jgi:hypothetical protein